MNLQERVLLYNKFDFIINRKNYLVDREKKSSTAGSNNCDADFGRRLLHILFIHL